MKLKILVTILLIGGLSLILTANAQSAISSKQTNINSLTTAGSSASFTKSIEISPTQITTTQASCRACVDGKSTGKIDANGCLIYDCPTESCPSCNINNYVCCESFGYGAKMVKTPSSYALMPKSQCKVAAGFVGGGKNIVDKNFCEPKSCTACAGGQPTGRKDSDGCPVYSCPMKACLSGCTCSGDTVTCPAEGAKPIETRISSESGNKTVSIEKSPNGLSFESNNVKAITSKALVVTDEKLSLKTSAGDKEIKILPAEASLKATAVTKVNAIELKEESQQPIYAISGTKQVKLFSLISISMPIETKVSAESGNVISVKKPWWSFFAR